MDSHIKERTKYLIVAFLTAACLALIHFFQAALEVGGFFTHFFYIPIILSAFWWKKKGLIVPAALGLYLMFSRYCCLGSDVISLNKYFEIMMFVVIALLVTFLSERIQWAEEKLHESDARYRLMFEHMSEGVVVYKAVGDGADFVFVDMNAAAENIDHLMRERIIGRSLLEVFAPPRQSGLHEILKRVWATGSSESCAECFYQGERVSSWRQCSIYSLPTGEIVSLYCDRTEQKKAEERILQLASIVESADDAIVSMNLAGVIQSWNPGAQRIYGYAAEEIVGQPILVLVAEHRMEEVKANLGQIKKGENLENYETVHLHKDDRRLEVSLTLSPLKDLGGIVVGASMIARNIMRRKKAERALQKAYEQLEMKVEERTRELKTANETLRKEIIERERIEEALTESSEKIKAFAYVICHDLKSPAVGIHGLTTLLRNQYGEILDEQGRRYCEQIVKAAEQIGALIKQINVYIATKESPLTIEAIELKELFQALKDEFSVQLNTRRIHWREPEKAVQVRADRLSLTRVFRNLVDNALKYGGDKLSEITIGYAASEHFHTLSVGDDGAGIEGEDYDKIFGLFQRHPSARGIEGAGLGLAIVKEAAERHHGKVWLESAPERGTTFFVTIAKEL